MCKYCKQPEDDGVEFKKDTVNLGALGELEVTSSIWNYDLQDKAFLLFDVWLDRGNGHGEDLIDLKTYISFCPFCGKNLRKKSKKG